ncbi:MAG: cytochrome c [Gemmatimonadota bacterium]|nr:cytochrome c [Gemmatimonadota bacterium]
MRILPKLPPLVAVLVVASCSTAPSTGDTGTVSPDVGDGAPEDAPAEARTDVSAVPAEQAQRGENAFLASCTACHASGEFSDSAFRRRWQNRTAEDLYRLTASTMPEDAPNSLPPERYVDIVAYILTLNGFESVDGGEAWNVPVLDQVSLAPLAGS